jgi:hypothetical protein
VSDLSPFEINRQVREREERGKRKRRDIQATAEAPDEILTVMNCALAVADGEANTCVVNVVKANGQQLHLVLQPDGVRALIQGLSEWQTRASENGHGGPLEIPGS